MTLTNRVVPIPIVDLRVAIVIAYNLFVYYLLYLIYQRQLHQLTNHFNIFTKNLASKFLSRAMTLRWGNNRIKRNALGNFYQWQTKVLKPNDKNGKYCCYDKKVK